MNKLLPFFLLFLPWLSYGQDSVFTESCKACFSFKVNTEIKTILPSTVLDFVDCSEGNVVESFWEFGNGQISTETNPTIIFNHPFQNDSMKVMFNPFVTISLTIFTDDGCKDHYSTTLNILDPFNAVEPDEPPVSDCIARFKYYVMEYDTLNQLATVQFNNRSEGNNLSYSWYFGDSLFLNEAEPVVSFDFSRSERKVCLSVENDKGCNNTFCDAVWLLDPNEPWIEPVDTNFKHCQVAFGYKVNSVVKTFAPALVLDFYPQTDEDVVKMLWDFGDGTSSNEKYPTHIFNLPLLNEANNTDSLLYRNVCLTITNYIGCETTYCETIWLNGIVEPEKCFSWFTWSVPNDILTIPEVKPIRLHAESNTEIASVEWFFEDGTTSTDLEALVMLDKFKPMHKIGLKTTSINACTSFYSEVIYLGSPVDTISNHPECNYQLKIDGNYPIWASACVGKATARLFFNDSIEVEGKFVWSNGIEEANIEDLCPTQKYGIIAYAPDGCKVISNFVFNSDGSVTTQPAFWWAEGTTSESNVYVETYNKSFTAYWILCDGTLYEGNRVPLGKINCAGNQTNLVVKDEFGNVVYSESIGLRSAITSTSEFIDKAQISFFPNPVHHKLKIAYLGKPIKNAEFELYDLTGRLILRENLGAMNRNQVHLIDLSEIPVGLYLGKVLTRKQTLHAQRLVK